MVHAILTIMALATLLGWSYKTTAEYIEDLEALLQMTFPGPVKQIPAAYAAVLQHARKQLIAGRFRTRVEALRDGLVAQRRGELTRVDLAPDAFQDALMHAGLAVQAMANHYQRHAGSGTDREAAAKAALAVSWPLYNLVHGVQVRAEESSYATERDALIHTINEFCFLLPKILVLDGFLRPETPSTPVGPAAGSPHPTAAVRPASPSMVGSSFLLNADDVAHWIERFWQTVDEDEMYRLYWTVGLTSGQWTVMQVAALAHQVQTETLLDLYSGTLFGLRRQELASAFETVGAGAIAELLQRVDHHCPAPLSPEPGERLGQFAQLGPDGHAAFDETTAALREALKDPAFINAFRTYVTAHAAELPWKTEG